MLDEVSKSAHLDGKVSHRVAPGPEVDLSNEEQRKKWVQEFCMSEYHLCGSVASTYRHISWLKTPSAVANQVYSGRRG